MWSLSVVVSGLFLPVLKSGGGGGDGGARDPGGGKSGARKSHERKAPLV